MFAGRKEELSSLNSFYEKADARVACVYGRKGMGKTTLLKEFCKDKTTVFFTAYPTTDVQELSILAAAIAGGEVDFDEDDLTLPLLLDEITKIGSRQPLLLIIDHYPYFIKAANDYDKILHSYVKEQWSVATVCISPSAIAFHKTSLSLFVLRGGAMTYFAPSKPSCSYREASIRRYCGQVSA